MTAYTMMGFKPCRIMVEISWTVNWLQQRAWSALTKDEPGADHAHIDPSPVKRMVLLPCCLATIAAPSVAAAAQPIEHQRN
jgi:hypothetical protein